MKKLLRKIIVKLDKMILGGLLRNYYLSYIKKRKINIMEENKNSREEEINIEERKILNYAKERLHYSFNIQYSKNDSSLLNLLCDKYGSDKGESSSDNHPYPWTSHNYTDFYNLAFGLRRNNVKIVVECGLGTNNPNLPSNMGINGKPGASLRVWRDYFPNALIIGCDIDSEILFEEDRIKTFECDQTDSDSINHFVDSANLKDGTVDIIIDDGLHYFFAGICYFENMIKMLANDGIYIIEDITPPDMAKYKDYFFEKSEYYDVQYVHLYTPQKKGGDENNRLVVIKKKLSVKI